MEECRVFRVIRTGKGVHVEEEVLWRANRTSFPAEYWSYPQRRGEEVVGAVVAFIDITERKLAEAALASVSRRLIEAQEQERSRIARELHDDIGQRLALLAIELEQLQQNPPNLSEVRSRMGELRKQTSEIATDIQSLSHELHSSKLEYLGIAAAMRGFCQEFGEQQKVEIDFKTHDLPSPLPPDISLCLFRVLQEALHNSAKHSGVRRFEVRLWGTSDEIHLTVRDSGVGFDSESGKGEPRAWPHQHGGAAETTEGNVFNRIATQAWYHDPRSRCLSVQEAIPCVRPGKRAPTSRNNGSVSAANSLEDLLIFLAVKSCSMGIRKEYPFRVVWLIGSKVAPPESPHPH